MHDRLTTQSPNSLLALLPAADFALLKPQLREIPLRQGAVLQEPGEFVQQVYFPIDGIISLLAVMRTGEAIETATIGREGAVGSLAGLGPRRSYTRAVVQVDGAALRIPAATFRAASERSAAIFDTVVRYSEMLLIQVGQTAACNALHDVEARLSRWLLQANDRLEGNTVGLTHEFLSQMLGVRRTTVTVVASNLQQAGLIKYRRGQIVIVDRPGLEARACECYAAIRDQINGVLPAAVEL